MITTSQQAKYSRRIPTLAVLAACALLAAACSSGDDDTQGSSPATSPGSVDTTEPTVEEEPDDTTEVEPDDTTDTTDATEDVPLELGRGVTDDTITLGYVYLDLDAVRDAINPRTRLVLLNTPHNPTGTVFTPEELRELARLCVEHDLLVISDEVYEHLVYDDKRHLPLATYPGMAERTVTISSAAKMFNCTGWKIGWLCGPPALVAAARTAKQFLTYVNGAPFQPAIAVGLAFWLYRVQPVWSVI